MEYPYQWAFGHRQATCILHQQAYCKVGGKSVVIRAHGAWKQVQGSLKEQLWQISLNYVLCYPGVSLWSPAVLLEIAINTSNFDLSLNMPFLSIYLLTLYFLLKQSTIMPLHS